MPKHSSTADWESGLVAFICNPRTQQAKASELPNEDCHRIKKIPNKKIVEWVDCIFIMDCCSVVRKEAVSITTDEYV